MMTDTPAPWSEDFDFDLHDRDDYWKGLKASDLSFCVLGEGSQMLGDGHSDQGNSLVILIPTAALEADESIYEWEFPLEPMLGEHADNFMCSMEGVWEFEGNQEECHQLLESLGAMYNPDILEDDPDLVAYEP